MERIRNRAPEFQSTISSMHGSLFIESMIEVRFNPGLPNFLKTQIISIHEDFKLKLNRRKAEEMIK